MPWWVVVGLRDYGRVLPCWQLALFPGVDGKFWQVPSRALVLGMLAGGSVGVLGELGG